MRQAFQSLCDGLQWAKRVRTLLNCVNQALPPLNALLGLQKQRRLVHSWSLEWVAYVRFLAEDTWPRFARLITMAASLLRPKKVTRHLWPAG